jgi:hypothetical protein
MHRLSLLFRCWQKVHSVRAAPAVRADPVAMSEGQR